MPPIPNRLLDGIAFLYPTIEQAEANEKCGGTAFFLSINSPDASEAFGEPVHIPFLISNRHVVFEGSSCIARINRETGPGKIIEINQEDWIAHPNGDDVAAVCVFGTIDRVEDRITTANFTQLVSRETADEADFGIGDEVFMLGRFMNHQGDQAEIRAAARFGSISMPPAPIWNSVTKRRQESWAVEMRSRTGFSGSPVMVWRLPGWTLKELPEGMESGWAVLGVNWGYIIDEETGESTWLNGVVPSWKIRELLNVPELKEEFYTAQDILLKLARRGGAVPTVARGESSEPPTTDDNPQHREDFNSLLDAAVRRPPKDDRT